MPHFSQDGVFIHELRYYRPSAYCVDGELDTEEYDYEEEEGGEQLSYMKVMLCEEKGESMGGCKGNEDQNCYHRWESFYCNMITVFSSLILTPGVVIPGSPCMMTCA